jgi:hypothetical protein
MRAINVGVCVCARTHLRHVDLTAIQTAYLIVVLDSASPASQDEAAALCLAGDGYNRWYDKFVSLIVFANGMAGCNGEHTPVDAPTTNTIFAHLTDDGHDAKAVSVCEGCRCGCVTCGVTRADLRIDCACVRAAA